MEKSLHDFNLNGTNLVRMVWNRKKVFLIIGAVAFAASLVVSFLIHPQYQSTAILMPALSTQPSKDIVVPTRIKGITMFGEDEELEHLLQVLSSETLRRTMVIKHDLFKHYGIDPNDKHAWFKVNGTYAKNISFSPSKFRSVRIQVLDSHPENAAMLANSIVLIADSLMRKTKREVVLRALPLFEEQYQFALSEIQRVEDSLSAVMKRGVLDLPFQAKEYTSAYASALKSGDNASAQRIKKAMENLAESGGPFTRYLQEMEHTSQQLKEIKEALFIMRIEAAGEIPSQFVIDWAVPTDMKAKPKKSIIVIISTLSALFFAFFLFVLVDFFRKSINPIKGEE